MMMKTTRFLTLAAGLLAVSTTTFAQNFVTYPQVGGGTWAAPGPIDRFTPADFGYRRPVIVRPHTNRYYSYSERGGCLPDQERSNRTGYCRPARSQQ
jgi:hypothetical protein